MESGVGCGHSRINRGLHQNLFEIARFEFVMQSRSYMQTKLFPPSGRAGNREHEQAPRSPIETGTRPEKAPREARNQLLEITVEIRGCGGRAIHMLVAESLASNTRAIFRFAEKEPP